VQRTLRRRDEACDLRVTTTSEGSFAIGVVLSSSTLLLRCCEGFHWVVRANDRHVHHVHSPALHRICIHTTHGSNCGHNKGVFTTLTRHNCTQPNSPSSPQTSHTHNTSGSNCAKALSPTASSAATGAVAS